MIDQLINEITKRRILVYKLTNGDTICAEELWCDFSEGYSITGNQFKLIKDDDGNIDEIEYYNITKDSLQSNVILHHSAIISSWLANTFVKNLYIDIMEILNKNDGLDDDDNDDLYFSRN